MYTFQDFEKDKERVGVSEAVQQAIAQHRGSREYRTSLDADNYDAQRNTTIKQFVKWLYNFEGSKVQDITSSNNKLCSNFFARLNTQRCTYSLGNGITFAEDGFKERLGEDTIDKVLKDAGYYALIHGVSYIFFNVDHCHCFKLTEFAPLIDEEDGTLRAGIRFWRVDASKPSVAVLYEEDGYTRFIGSNEFGAYEVTEDKKSYRMTIQKAQADAEPEVIAEENYSSLPIKALYGSRLRQSTLVGTKANIDAYDLVNSGFANDMTDCAEIYWIVAGAGASDERDLARFRDRMKLNHIASVTDANEIQITPYTQEIPYQARQTFLEQMHNQIYADFGALDIRTITAGSTNDHIDASYQPLDENADDFEYQVIETVQSLLALTGNIATPIFKRNKISNHKEQTEMVLMASQYLDNRTVLSKLPFITPDEIDSIIENADLDNMRIGGVDLDGAGENT